jgi:glutathione S-transferase
MSLVALVTLLILIQYIVFFGFVGKARVEHNIMAPAISGHPDFERAYRVQMNTVEQLVLTLPAMWICAYFFMPIVASALGVGFFIGRLIYRNSYVKDPETRSAGFGIGALSTLGMLGCGLWGAISGM